MAPDVGGGLSRLPASPERNKGAAAQRSWRRLKVRWCGQRNGMAADGSEPAVRLTSSLRLRQRGWRRRH